MLENIISTSKNQKPLLCGFTQKLDKANPKRLRQLGSISLFSKQTIHLSGSENSAEDTLSRLYQINIPATLETQEFQDE
jgi:hypothetical protein